MQTDKPTQSCGRGRSCCSIYGRLGQTKGPSVTWDVLVAFGIPVVVFIISLAAAGAVLGAFKGGPTWPTILALGVALALTAAVVAAIWKITQRPVNRLDQQDRN